MSLSRQPSTTTLFLSGGQGSRLGGIDKGLTLYQNKTLIAHAISRHCQSASAAIISANRNLDDYKQWQIPVVTDGENQRAESATETSFHGPLAGIIAALKACSSELMIVIPVDMPLLPDDYVEQMCRSFQRLDKPFGYLATDERAHYLNCIFETSLSAEIQRYFTEGGRSIRGLIERVEGDVLDLALDEYDLRNFNREEDFR